MHFTGFLTLSLLEKGYQHQQPNHYLIEKGHLRSKQAISFGRGFLKNRHLCFESSHSLESSLRSLSTM